jgi:hypothetical protein
MRPYKVILGLATLLLWVGIAYLVSTGFTPVDSGTDPSLRRWMNCLFVTTGMFIVLLPIYIVHVETNKNLTLLKQMTWVALLLFGSILAMPIYWYLHIWRMPTLKSDT